MIGVMQTHAVRCHRSQRLVSDNYITQFGLIILFMFIKARHVNAFC